MCQKADHECFKCLTDSSPWSLQLYKAFSLPMQSVHRIEHPRNDGLTYGQEDSTQLKGDVQRSFLTDYGQYVPVKDVFFQLVACN